GPLYLDLGDFSFSPLEPDENGDLLTSSSISSIDDAKKTASSTSSPITSNSSIYDTPTIKLTSKNLSDLDGSSNDQSKQTSPFSKKGLSNINSQTDNIPNYLKPRKPHHLKPALKAYMESFNFEKDPIDIAL
ncbi:22061_t:CDS:2, partial [Racocetra persica]